MDGPRDGCSAPYATCTRDKDARVREAYIRKLERVRDLAIECQRWVDDEADDGETVELD